MESVSYKLMLNGLGPTALGAEIPITLRFDAGETFGFTAIVQKLEPVATDQPAVLLADEVGDPRADPPRMIAATEVLGMDVAPPPSPVTAANSIEELLASCLEAEAGFNALGDFVVSNTPQTSGVSSRTEVITGVDGNDINLYIHRPDGADGPMPCIVHTHGGGMAILKAANPSYGRWRDDLAATGMVVVGVEFRNAAGELGPHPFPAGVYAQCPYISNAYAEPLPELAALFENDNYFLNIENMGRSPRPTAPTAPMTPTCWHGECTPRAQTSKGCRRTSFRSTSSTHSVTRGSSTSASCSMPE